MYPVEKKQMKELKEQMQKMNVSKGSSGDRGFRRLVFTQMPKETSYDDRVHFMRSFMDKHFPKVFVNECSVFFSGSFKDGNRSMTRTGYIELASSDVRNRVLDEIDRDENVPKGDFKPSGELKKFQGVKVQRGRTQSASDRHKALRDAADLLKTLVQKDDHSEVVIQWVGSRGVTVRGVFAFEQPAGHCLGDFCGEEFGHLELP